MSILGPARSSWLPDRRAAAEVLIVSGVLMAIVVAFHRLGGIPVGDLTRDPLSIAELPPHLGLLSQVGLFFWAAAATLCLFGARVLGSVSTGREARLFLGVMGISTLALGVDDAFQLHEEVLPALGIPQLAILAVYGATATLILLRFRAVVLEREVGLFLLVIAGFGTSVLLDVWQPPGLNPYFFEDGAKLAGLVAWTLYVARAALRATRAAARSGENEVRPE